MPREELLELARALGLSNPCLWRARKARKQQYAQALGGIALSYARAGDVSMVAALVQAAAHLGLICPSLSDAEIYLLEQQHPDGSFGFLAKELAQLNNETERIELKTRLTVEVLWALTEIATLKKM